MTQKTVNDKKNKSSRRKAREQALQILYQADISGKDAAGALGSFIENFEHNRDDTEFVAELVNGVLDNRDTIDAHITKHAHNWKLSRIAPIDRNLLRLAIYEICVAKTTAGPIVINEAVELAKKFGQNETPAFVNGILDAISREQ